MANESNQTTLIVKEAIKIYSYFNIAKKRIVDNVIMVLHYTMLKHLSQCQQMFRALLLEMAGYHPPKNMDNNMMDDSEAKEMEFDTVTNNTIVYINMNAKSSEEQAQIPMSMEEAIQRLMEPDDETLYSRELVIKRLQSLYSAKRKLRNLINSKDFNNVR